MHGYADEAADYLKGVPEDQRAYGIISAGAALGDDEYVQMYLREKGDELCAEGGGIIDRIAAGLASKSEQAANVASVLSLQERINYLAGTHLPSETMELRQMVDAALRRADEHILGADFMNDQGIERAPGQYLVNDPTFTRDRHLLKTSAGGNGRLVLSCLVY